MAGSEKDSGKIACDQTEIDPVAVFLSDPEGHLSDILYLNFRVYKKKLLWNFLERALADLRLGDSDTLFIADVGASMGCDVLCLLRRLTRNFCQPLPCERVCLSLVEGNLKAIQAGERFLAKELARSHIDFKYFSHPLLEELPLQENTHHLAICSEVVEHLEEPERLLSEIFRVLRPGGFLMLTTDNSPSFPQRLKRIPIWLSGKYSHVYKRPTKEDVTFGKLTWNGKEYLLLGHINLNPTRYWEKLCIHEGFEIASYGTYESIRRGGGSKSPVALMAYFMFGAFLYYLVPKRVGRYFGDTTALLLKKPEDATWR